MKIEINPSTIKTLEKQAEEQFVRSYKQAVEEEIKNLFIKEFRRNDGSIFTPEGPLRKVLREKVESLFETPKMQERFTAIIEEVLGSSIKEAGNTLALHVSRKKAFAEHQQQMLANDLAQRSARKDSTEGSQD